MLDKAHRWACRSPRSGGFTVVELLVVVAIISVLLSILLPSFKLAREQAKQVVCSSRLMQWGLAFSCYEAENNGVWPHCDGLDRGPRDLDDPMITQEDVADWHGWVDLLPRMLGFKVWRDHPRYERPNHTTFFQCPFGRTLPGKGLYSYNPERDGYFSYAMNSCLGLDLNAWQPPDYDGPPMPSFLNTVQIVRPPRVILLFDQLLDPHKGYDGQMVNRSAGEHCGSYPKAFSARHRRTRTELGGDLLFCDGHAEWRASVWKADWDPDQEVPPRDDQEWFPYPAR